MIRIAPSRSWRQSLPGVAAIAIRLLSIAAGLALVKSYTGALSLSEVGRFFYLSTLSYAINALVFVPVDFYMQARLARLDVVPVPGLWHLVSRVLAWGLAACVALGIPLWCLGKLQAADLPVLYAAAALLYLCSTLRNLLNNRGNTVFVSAMLLLEAVGRLVAFLAVAALAGASARGLMVSTAIALLAELAVILAQLRRVLPLSHAPGALDPAGAVVRIAAPLAGSAVCNAVQLQAYRVAYPLAGFSAASGLYGVVANVGGAAMAACASIYQQLQQPQLYQSDGTSLRRYVSRAVLLGLGVLVVVLAAAPLLVGLLTKERYVAYSAIVGFGVVVEACSLVAGAYTVVLSLRGRTDVMLRFYLAAAALSLGGCLAALAWRPDNPYLVGVVVAGSQLLLTLAMAVHVSRRPVPVP